MCGGFVRGWSSSHAVGAMTRAVPTSATAFTPRFHSQASNASANTICDSPTTLTLAGVPLRNASVRKICPTVAVTPIPSSFHKTLGSSAFETGCAFGPTAHATPHTTVATAEKWTTIARGSIPCRACSPSIATAVNRAAASALYTPTFPASRCGCSTSTTPSTPTNTASHIFPPGALRYSGHDSSATQIGNVFVSVTTSDDDGSLANE